MRDMRTTRAARSLHRLEARTGKQARVSVVVGGIASLFLVLGWWAMIGFERQPRVTVAADWLHLSSKRGNLPTPGTSRQQTASLIADIDQDGFADIVIGARKRSPALVWFKRTAVAWERYVIDSEVLPIEAGGAFEDVDGDGDIDIVMGEDASGNKVYWWENPHPSHHPSAGWRRRVIKGSGEKKHHDQLFGDFDGNGKSELVFWNQRANALMWAEIPGHPKAAEPWSYQTIFVSPSQSEGLAKADIDGDGILDIIGGGRWFKHTSGAAFLPEVIDDGMRFTRAAAGQLKKGGRPEVVFVAGDSSSRLRWYEWSDAGWLGHDLLNFDVTHGHSLQVVDVNGDGSLDVFCAEMHTPGRGEKAEAWIFYGDGQGNFRKEIIATGLGNHESRMADLDGDGDVDILVKPYTWDAPRLDVLLNKRSALDRWQRHVIDRARPWRAVFIAAADVDADGRTDIITGGWWYKNPGELGGTWQRKEIGQPLRNMAAVYDFDGDGDQDVLGTKGKGSERNSSLVWARNEGAGIFRVIDNIASGEGDFLQGVAIHRSVDGSIEVALSWHEPGRGIQMLTVPPNPVAERWPIARSSAVSQDEALSAGDIDGDGTSDLLLGTEWLHRVPSTWIPRALAPDGRPDRNRLADINGDGFLDAVVGFEAVNTLGDLAWYENPKRLDTPWNKHLVASLIGPMSLDVADVDHDGDDDIAVGEHNMAKPATARLYVLENKDGAGQKWIGHMVHSGDEHHDGAMLVDIDNDHDLDILSIGWSHGKVLLYVNESIAQPPKS